MNFVTVNNAILDLERVMFLWQDEKDIAKITVVFEGGVQHEFRGAEAAQIWKHFDEGGWREGGIEN